ncbi:MAG: glycosyltransferase family 4 protein [Robiginitomaculum sp.]|nr:glycosyltransferase family 4 protein [Robiginitomaculum sp.]
MKILVLTPESYGGFGGVAVYNIDFINALANSSLVDNITVIPRVIRVAPNNIPANVKFIKGASGGLASYLRHVMAHSFKKYDLVICTHMYLLPFAKLKSFFTREPAACILYGLEAWKPTRRFMVDNLVKKCTPIISISDFTNSKFMEWSNVGAKQTVILPNAYHKSEFTAKQSTDYLVDRYDLKGRKIILSFGRLDTRERQKGFDEVINLMPSLLKKQPNLVYLIAGGGDDRPRLEALASSLDLTSAVKFCGRITENEKADHYRLADVFSLVGRQEGFGFVLIEALACGTPVVASVLDGSQDAILGGELGELANPDDPKSLEDALFRALKKPKGVPEKLEYFSFENFQSRLEAIIIPFSKPNSQKAKP